MSSTPLLPCSPLGFSCVARALAFSCISQEQTLQEYFIFHLLSLNPSTWLVPPRLQRWATWSLQQHCAWSRVSSSSSSRQHSIRSFLHLALDVSCAIFGRLVEEHFIFHRLIVTPWTWLVPPRLQCPDNNIVHSPEFLPVPLLDNILFGVSSIWP